MRDYLFAAFLFAAVPICLFNPFFGVLCWTWIGFFNPQQMSYGFMHTLPVALMVAVPTLIGLLFTSQRRFPPITRETLVLLMLWLWFCVTTISAYYTPLLSTHFDDSLTKLWQVSKMLLMVFVLLALVHTRGRLRSLALVTAASFGFFCLKALAFGAITRGADRVYGPPGSMIADNNDFALAVNMCLPLFAYVSIGERRWIRNLAKLCFAGGVAAVLLTYSRGGLLGLAVVLCAMAIRSRHKLLAGAVIGIFALAFLAVAPSGWLSRMSTLESAAQVDSAQERFRSWKLSTDIALDYPITGGGFDTFTADLFARYNLPGEKTWSAHSIYFQMLAEHGFPGLLLFLLLIFWSVRSCRKLSRTSRDVEGQAWIGHFANAFEIGLYGYVVSGAFLGRAYFDLFYQIVACVIVLKALAKNEPAALEMESPATESKSFPLAEFEPVQSATTHFTT